MKADFHNVLMPAKAVKDKGIRLPPKMEMELKKGGGDSLLINHVSIVVKLWSNNQPQYFSKWERVFIPNETLTDMRKGVAVGSAVLAERQNTHYADGHDPSECARLAVELLSKLISMAENESKQSIEDGETVLTTGAVRG